MHLHRESMTVVCGNFHLSEVYTDTYHTSKHNGSAGLTGKGFSAMGHALATCSHHFLPEVAAPRPDDQNLSTARYLGGLFTAFFCRCEAS